MREYTLVFLSDWMETPARVNIKQPWKQVALVTPCGLRLVITVVPKRVYSREVISSDSPNRWCATACLCIPSVGIRLGTVMVRIRESLHTMLLTISKSEPVSAGMFITNKVLCSSTYQPFHFHQYHSCSTCSYLHLRGVLRTTQPWRFVHNIC